MDMLKRSLDHLYHDELLPLIQDAFEECSYDHGRHLINLSNENGSEIGYVRLPLHLQVTDDLQVVDHEAMSLYLAVESGNAAICLMDGTELEYHTTFSAYMTRKKQGFSQIKYLNKKGKSRAGSRVRLAETVTFFENINTTMVELMEDYAIDRLGLSCSTSLIPYLFQSKVPFPVDKKDSMLYKIPLHIPQSNFTNLKAAIDELSVPTVFYKAENESSVQEAFSF
ncbi:hypothetical protein [Marinoscillum furvescens]|uniref:VLRF1 domain-containing protein n=1 Tax=Marinoscillum furvescens DSM 4134 TaxID=1122208 RepID=A0A3D9L1H0_MARFU|nr:hypothetical protein [Marinoscillum furvescens]RED97906.1 hypothetical protein C7460_11147 [Marinoscillum furvescens DSM 4134]